MALPDIFGIIPWTWPVKIVLIACTAILLVLSLCALRREVNRGKREWEDDRPVFPCVEEAPRVTNESVIVSEPVLEAIAEPATEEEAEPVLEEVAEPATEEEAEPVLEEVAEPATEEEAEPVLEEVAEEQENMAISPITVPENAVFEQPAAGTEIDIDAIAVVQDDASDSGRVIVDGKEIYVRYSRSFTARLCQAEQAVQRRYSELKNELLDFGVRSRVSFKSETFRLRKNTYAQFSIQGKTLSLYLALDPEEFADTKYIFQNVGDKKRYAEVPFRLKLRSDRAMKWGVELIDILMERAGLERIGREPEDFTVAYRTTEELIRAGEIKVFATGAHAAEKLQGEAFLKQNSARFVRVDAEEDEQTPVAEDSVVEEPIVEESVIEEPIVEEPIVEEPIVEEPVAIPDEQPAAGTEIDIDAIAVVQDDASDSGRVIVDGKEIYVRYSRSFTARLCQAEQAVQRRYSELKNELLDFGVRSRVSFKSETFRLRKNTYAQFSIQGKTLSLYLALDPEEFADTKYIFQNVGDKKRYAEVPFRLKLRSDRAMKWGVELIDILMERAGLERIGREPEDFTVAYRTTEELIRAGEIKVFATGAHAAEKLQGEAFLKQNSARFVRVDAEEDEQTPVAEVEALPFEIHDAISAEQASEMSDELAQSLIGSARELDSDGEPTSDAAAPHVPLTSKKEARKALRKAPIASTRGLRKKEKGPALKGKAVVNIDTLAAHFSADSLITVEEMKAKGLVPKGVLKVKVLGRGVLTKPLRVEADEFSLLAVKMILLTGGRVWRK
ncbi:MAG: hypothetical protein E7663_01285 [Ruminococcaceae bacterium]|nr:hypothetical protein [Oscillospiraceae bacterium]